MKLATLIKTESRNIYHNEICSLYLSAGLFPPTRLHHGSAPPGQLNRGHSPTCKMRELSLFEIMFPGHNLHFIDGIVRDLAVIVMITNTEIFNMMIHCYV